MIAGFTGTRADITEEQYDGIVKALDGSVVTELRHGDCIGADAYAHEIALSMGIDVGIHPPIDDRLRAFCKGAKRMFPKKSYIQRNHDIVDACDFLIACPLSEQEILRSGTWSTIRYARKKRVPIILLPGIKS